MLISLLILFVHTVSFFAGLAVLSKNKECFRCDLRLPVTEIAYFSVFLSSMCNFVFGLNTLSSFFVIPDQGLTLYHGLTGLSTLALHTTIGLLLSRKDVS